MRQCNIPVSLASGQTFRWRRRWEDWIGPIEDSAVLLRPREEGFYWQTYPIRDRWELIERYLALDVNLEALTAEWAAAEPRALPAIGRFSGLRVLRQTPEEAFFSFLCASCNTIVKITRTIQALERRAGKLITELNGEAIYSFPSAGTISELAERDLRADLWGYRAPRLIELAGYAASQGPGWLASLSRIPYREAHRELTALFGVGAKLADCICLFGLGHSEAVPIDTHVRQVALHLFRPDLRSRSLTPSVYWTLGDLFRERFGAYAGWAQQYLFMHHLKPETAERNDVRL